MAKLKLNVDALTVDSFEPAKVEHASGGTVRGRELTQRVDTCTCPDTSVKNPCFCTEYPTCWNCDVA